MMSFRQQGGFALVTVLIITAIGLLFGAGALLLFRYQCQMRIDRQHELEKMYAVRSALNYLRMETITEPGGLFYYHTGSDRDLGVFIKPAKTFFPSNRIENVEKGISRRHFVMEWGDLYIPPAKRDSVGGYNSDRDYEYGAEGVTNLCVAIANKHDVQGLGIVFNSDAASLDSEAMKCWVNIGMAGTGGWLQEEYGRRYCFESVLQDGDIVRMWLIRYPENAVDKSDGKSFGWPPSGESYPLMLELMSLTGGYGRVRLFECQGDAPGTVPLCDFPYIPINQNLIGVQLAHDKASLFYVKNDAGGTGLDVDLLLRSIEFSNIGTLSSLTYKYYYTGSKEDVEGRIVQAPELRTVFEFNANPSSNSDPRWLSKFKVTPGYQYDISLVYPEGVTNLATVAQKIGKYQQTKNDPYTVLTYDTHGTENKGFRKDERLWREAQQ